MDTSDEVLEAARHRAVALMARDPEALLRLLHPQFRWFSDAGERFDRDSYVRFAVEGAGRRAGEDLREVNVVAHASTAVLRGQTVDVVRRGDGVEELRTPVTQVWVRDGDRWVCLIGHSGLART